MQLVALKQLKKTVQELLLDARVLLAAEKANQVTISRAITEGTVLAFDTVLKHIKSLEVYYGQLNNIDETGNVNLDIASERDKNDQRNEVDENSKVVDQIPRW